MVSCRQELSFARKEVVTFSEELYPICWFCPSKKIQDLIQSVLDLANRPTLRRLGGIWDAQRCRLVGYWIRNGWWWPAT